MPLVFGQLGIHGFIQLVRLTVDAVQIFGKIFYRPILADILLFQILLGERSVLAVGVPDRSDNLPLDFDFLFGQPLASVRFCNDFLCVHDCASFALLRVNTNITFFSVCQGFWKSFQEKIFTAK